MIRKAIRPALERIIEAIAAVALGGAVGFAVGQGASWGVAGVAGAVVASAALVMLARIDRADTGAAERFEAIDFPGNEGGESGEHVLLLDDPLPALDQQSRVVRLFAATPRIADEGTAPIAAPGEMVARIAHFLGSPRDHGGGDLPQGVTRATSDEANAALHAALADIRRSLRHG